MNGLGSDKDYKRKMARFDSFLNHTLKKMEVQAKRCQKQNSVWLVNERRNHKNRKFEASQLPFLSGGPVLNFVFTPEVEIAESLLIESNLFK